MGGCRCVFRDCVVSTARNPRMHFFHFPVKDRKRMLQWVEYSGQQSLLKLPLSLQKNRVVCVRHFRDECFMNYKRDRLTGTAVPTLMRLGNSAISFECNAESEVVAASDESATALALDYSKLDAEGEPEVVALEKTTKQHLIPPPDFECPLDMEMETELPQYKQKRKLWNSDLLVLQAENDDAPETDICAGGLNIEYVHEAELVVAGGGVSENPKNSFKASSSSSLAKKQPQKRIQMLCDKEVTPAKKPKILNVAAQSKVALERPMPAVCGADAAEQAVCTKLIEVVDSDLDSAVIEMDSDNSSESLQMYEMADIDDDEILELTPECASSTTDNIDLQLSSIQDSDAENIKDKSSSHIIHPVTPKLPAVENGISLEKHRAQMDLLRAELTQERSKHDEVASSMQVRLQELEATLKDANQQLDAQRHQLTETNTQNQKLCDQVATLRARNQQLQCDNAKQEAEHDTLRQESETLDVRLQALQARHTELQRKCAKLAAEAVAAQQQVATVSTSKELAAPATAPATAPPPPVAAASSSSGSLSKAQLFNGIKKYLSASMVALVRMEMFGNSEREWKPDERRASVDLLRLGEQVYKYFSDEWRFRLPALRHVRLWLNESAAVEDEDDL